MIDPSAFQFGNLDFVDMQRLVERRPLRQPEATPHPERAAIAAVLFVLSGAMAALRSWR